MLRVSFRFLDLGKKTGKGKEENNRTSSVASTRKSRISFFRAVLRQNVSVILTCV
jgi:hypothetical protein